MRNMSFALTTDQVRARTKRVTRRLGWWHLRAGERICACVKCRGLKPGEKIERLGVIEIEEIRSEPLARMIEDPAYGREEVILEGFPDLSPEQFVAFFCRSHKTPDGKPCTPATLVNRIAFDFR